jgi:predicted dehydrogenase
MVGYNRRFYAAAIRAKEEASSAHGWLANLVLPEGVRTPDHPEDNPEYLAPFFANSVHGLDLAQFILGDLTVSHVDRTYNPGGAITGLAAQLRAKSGAILQFTANWGTPANYSFTLDRPGRRYEMKPLEMASVYEGMDVVDPTPEIPLRSYQPRVIEKIDLTPDDLAFKPGFVAQAYAFAAMIHGGDSGPAAGLEDAFAVLELAEQLTGTVFPESSV